MSQGHLVSAVVIVALIAWSFYRRARRTLRMQPLRQRPLVIRTVLLLAIAVLIIAATWTHPLDLAFDALAILLGGVLAWLAARGTRIEALPAGGWQYRPSTGIGILVLALLLVRVGWRLWFAEEMLGQLPNSTATAAPGTVPASTNPYASDPVTAALLLIFVAYYAGYALWLMMKVHRLEREAMQQPEG